MRSCADHKMNVSGIPAIVLSAEFILGGWIRASPWPLRAAHDRVCQKNIRIVPILYPVVPFNDVTRHNVWVGTWMLVTGTLLASRACRGSKATLALVLFWTGAGAYSQWRAKMPFWLPICNTLLSVTVWWIENRSGNRKGSF